MDNELSDLIRRYFNAETSLADEKRLRQLLAQADDSLPDVAEAKAVAGYSLMPGAGAASRTRRRSLLHRAGIAAAIAAAVIPAGIVLGVHSDASARPVCVAYVNSVKVTDPATVRQMALDNLAMACEEYGAMSEAPLSELHIAVECNTMIDNQILPL